MPADCCVRTLLKMLQPENRDEPVFLLRAQDKTAPETLADWIKRAVVAGAPEDKLDKAREHLNEMIVWQAYNPERVKVPD